MRWENQQAEKRGQTVAEFLQSLVEQSGNKWRVMEAIAGVDYHNLIQIFRRNGITKTNFRHFECRGEMDTLSGHCRRLGVRVGRVEGVMRYHGLDRQAALEWVPEEAA